MRERKSMLDLEYSAGLMSQSCWFVEFKKLVRMRSEGMDEEAIRKECLENNLFGAVNENRTKRMYGYLKNRLMNLDDDGVRLFVSSDLATQKLLNLVAILRGDRMFFEFVYELYREKVILGHREITDQDVNVFFTTKGNQSDVVENFSESTKRHLKSNYLNCMADANLIRLEGRKRIITVPIVESKLALYLELSGDQSILTAISGVA
ncbi:MAG: DUF1819 family protein [Clostridia bacterium]|nr:DUF1819 family protein [Clostridia bacterium]